MNLKKKQIKLENENYKLVVSIRSAHKTIRPKCGVRCASQRKNEHLRMKYENVDFDSAYSRWSSWASVRRFDRTDIQFGVPGTFNSK